MGMWWGVEQGKTKRPGGKRAGRTPRETTKMRFQSNFLASLEHALKCSWAGKKVENHSTEDHWYPANTNRFLIDSLKGKKQTGRSNESPHKWQAQVTCNQIRCKHIKFIKEIWFVFLWSINNQKSKWTGEWVQTRILTYNTNFSRGKRKQAKKEKYIDWYKAEKRERGRQRIPPCIPVKSRT